MHYYNDSCGDINSKHVLGKEAITKKSNKDIWDVEEIVEGAEFDDSSDPRPQPE